MDLNLKTIWALVRQTSVDWNRHEATRLGASLAFYAVLSLAPLVILSLAVGSLFIGLEAAQQDIASQFQQLLGPDGAQAVQSVIAHGQNVGVGSVASALGLVILLFGASQVFAELQSALNKIWEADAAKTNGVLAMIRQRFFSFGLVLAIGLLLLVSLLLSAALAAAGSYMHGVLPLPEWLLRTFDFLFSVVATSALFALIFEYIPDAPTNWRDSWIGGLVTAGLFSLGKSLIGLYLGKAGIGSAYGAAGSLVVVVAWVYYSSQIFFFGAEFTHVITQSRHARAAKAAQPKRGAARREHRAAIATTR
jgi:membrane protein